MGYGLEILLPVVDRYEGESVKDIHDDLINSRLYNDLGYETVDHFSTWHMSCHDNSFLGKNEPEKLMEAVKNWNKPIEEVLKKELDKLFAAGSSEEALKRFEEGKLSAYNLYDALASFDDHFHYGEYKLVYSKDDEISIKIPKWMMKDIMEHPEDYAIIEVSYH